MLKLRVANYELNLELSKIFAESSFETVSCSSFLWVELLNSMSLKRVTENQISSSKIFHSQTFLLFSESFFENEVLNKRKNELTNATHDLYTLLFCKNDNFKYTNSISKINF